MIIKDAKLLPSQFWNNSDVLYLAQQTLGLILATQLEGILTYGRIVETEAYEGIEDKGSHVFGGKRTPRSELMYGKSGVAFVYLSYGMHHLMNIVTGPKETPHGILIRAIEPLFGVRKMAERSKKEINDPRIGRGPANATKALGITKAFNGIDLDGNKIGIYVPQSFPSFLINRGARIGIASAQEDALRPNRFWIENNPYVSK